MRLQYAHLAKEAFSVDDESGDASLSPRHIIFKRRYLVTARGKYSQKKGNLKKNSRCKFFQMQIFYIPLFIAACAHLAEERIEDKRGNDEVRREVGTEHPEHHLCAQFVYRGPCGYVCQCVCTCVSLFLCV